MSRKCEICRYGIIIQLKTLNLQTDNYNITIRMCPLVFEISFPQSKRWTVMKELTDKQNYHFVMYAKLIKVTFVNF